jgi:hypothetical protein
VTAYSERVCAALTGLLESRTRWDEAPDLYFLYADGPAMRVSADRSLVPADIWEDVPTFTLASMAGALETSGRAGALRAVAPPGLLGTVFRCEAWGVMLPDDPAEAEQARTMHANRKLAGRRDRIEQRHAWAVLRDGGIYCAIQSRGSGDIRAERLAGVEGLIPGSLARITRCLCSEAN